MENLTQKTATELLKLIDQGTVSSEEVTQQFIDKIKETHSQLKAVVFPLFEKALQRAKEADVLFREGKRMGKLHGLPITIKESLDYPETPSTVGVLNRKNDIPVTKDIYVEALEKEGAIVLGKTNVAQLLVFFESENPVYGRTNNAHSTRHTCGGSSGGEGAVVGAYASPIGIGTDIGGSIRIPAAFNGACGIKPTMARTIDQTRFVENPSAISINSVAGPISQDAESLQVFLEIMNEATVGRWETKPVKNFKEVDVTQLKVGYYINDGLFEPMKAVQEGILKSVEKLKAIGVEVVEFQPPNIIEAEKIFYGILAVNDASAFTDILKDDKPMPQIKDLMLMVKASPLVRKIAAGLLNLFGQKSIYRVIQNFGGKGLEFLAEIAKRQEAYTKAFESAMSNSSIGSLDAILSPINALPAYLHGASAKVGVGGTYSILHNVTGFPAGIATVGKVTKAQAVGRKTNADMLIKTAAKIEKSAEGLPLAIQIAARPWQEHLVIALIEQLHERI